MSRISVGDRFDRLVVVERVLTPGKRSGGGGLWLVQCDCSKRRTAYGSNLRSGRTRSCGCFNVETVVRRSTRHGQAPRSGYSAEYNVWARMIQRCEDPKSQDFPDYGGRGISVCSKWRDSFQAFFDDVGRRPSARHSIGRIDNGGNYEPGNVRWETLVDQANNKRTNHLVTAFGRTLTMAEWSRELGINYWRLRTRLKLGWSPERALSA